MLAVGFVDIPVRITLPQAVREIECLSADFEPLAFPNLERSGKSNIDAPSKQDQ